ncbi:MAG: hypothetical protein K9I74_09215 [Bacteroidales bacterium]|nr:hypothetical protein [Bacteroidales bacterium]
MIDIKTALPAAALSNSINTIGMSLAKRPRFAIFILQASGLFTVRAHAVAKNYE